MVHDEGWLMEVHKSWPVKARYSSVKMNCFLVVRYDAFLEHWVISGHIVGYSMRKINKMLM